MRASVALMILIVMCVSVRSRASADGDEDAVRIRIADYVHVQRETLDEMERFVGAVYARIGVAMKWAATLTFGPKLPDAPGDGPEDVTVILLDHEMAARQHFPMKALGLAAVGQLEPGRIAFIAYDRIQQAAWCSGWSTAEMLAVVVAHEVGHLLLPPDAHTPAGLMRGSWTVDDLRRTSREALGFTSAEGALIRETLGDPRGDQ
jgi:hypothetical protein